MTKEKKADKQPVTDDNDATEARQSRKRPIRVTRDLLVNKGPLQVPDSVRKSGMKYYWMKDGPYQFEKYNRLGYEFTMNDKGDKVSVGRAGEMLYLLEIEQDLYDEIQTLKRELLQEKSEERRGITNPRRQGSAEGIFEDRLIVK